MIDLTGDRALEWGYIQERLGRYVNKDSHVLDFGCGTGEMSIVAASLGAHVLAIDLMPQQFVIPCSNIEFRQVDVMTLDGKFDLIINCSTIEHVGLGGRYGSAESPGGDFDAMQKLRQLLKPDGKMLLTLPVGRDAVIQPLHRIYGMLGLFALLDGYRVMESSYYRKGDDNLWVSCSYGDAMTEKGGEHYYALGMMVLQHGQ